jgi:hypothetical protein
MNEFDNVHLKELIAISNSMNRDTIGHRMTRAMALRCLILHPAMQIRADEIMERIRGFTRTADVGWKIFEEPIMPSISLTEVQIWQLMGIVGTLLEFNYCFERVEEASFFTFENSAPVRFYVNAIFHYLTALFLLDTTHNKKKNLPRPGTVIKALHPMGLSHLLEPVYQVFERPFGDELSYGETILSIRNKGFVHGSFSPENIQRQVRDSRIFDETQKIRFIQNHWDLFDRLILLRLQLISILTYANVNLTTFTPSRLYHF